MKRIIFFSALLAFSLFSCTPEPVNEMAKASDSSTPCNDLNLNAANPKNVVDHIGQNHNASLDYAATLVDVSSASDQDLYNAMEDYFLTIPISNSFKKWLDATTYPKTYLDEKDIASGMTFAQYLEKYHPEEELIVEMMLELQKIVFETKYSNPQELIDNIARFENEFIENNSDSELGNYLGVFSVLRYSVKYWTEAQANVCHPWHEVVKQSNGPEKIDPWLLARLVIDCLEYNHCMSNGAGGADTLEDAQDFCLPGAIYASARAFE